VCLLGGIASRIRRALADGAETATDQYVVVSFRFVSFRFNCG
jgi:hypothetical protein